MHFVECLSKNTLYFIVFITNGKGGISSLNTKSKHIKETIQQQPVIQAYDRKFHIHLLNSILCSLFQSCQINTNFSPLQNDQKRHQTRVRRADFYVQLCLYLPMRHRASSLNSHKGLRFLNFKTKRLKKTNSKEHSHKMGFC